MSNIYAQKGQIVISSDNKSFILTGRLKKIKGIYKVEGLSFNGRRIGKTRKYLKLSDIEIVGSIIHGSSLSYQLDDPYIWSEKDFDKLVKESKYVISRFDYSAYKYVFQPYYFFLEKMTKFRNHPTILNRMVNCEIKGQIQDVKVIGFRNTSRVFFTPLKYLHHKRYQKEYQQINPEDELDFLYSQNEDFVEYLIKTVPFIYVKLSNNNKTWVALGDIRP